MDRKTRLSLVLCRNSTACSCSAQKNNLINTVNVALNNSQQQPIRVWHNETYILDYFEDVRAFISIHFGLHETAVHLKYVANCIQLTSYTPTKQEKVNDASASLNTQKNEGIYL